MLIYSQLPYHNFSTKYWQSSQHLMETASKQPAPNAYTNSAIKKEKENTQQSTTTRWSKVIMGNVTQKKTKTKQKYTTINHDVVMRLSFFLHHWSIPYWHKKRRRCICYSRYVFDELFLPGISLATLKVNLFLFRTSILSQNNVWTSCFVICYIHLTFSFYEHT